MVYSVASSDTVLPACVAVPTGGVVITRLESATDLNHQAPLFKQRLHLSLTRAVLRDLVAVHRPRLAYGLTYVHRGHKEVASNVISYCLTSFEQTLTACSSIHTSFECEFHLACREFLKQQHAPTKVLLRR